MKDKNPYKSGPLSALTLLVLGGVIPLACAAAEEEERAKKPITALELPEVEVVATTPLPSLGLPLSKVPGNVQSAEDEDIYRHEALDLTDFMRRSLGSVHFNDDQNNPFQPDITYRGFIASPLIGTPIGLSVYQDGVRVNEPFGDTVNWDLIPRSAIANLDLIPGSNPLFGLNTLGGALSVRTKSGFSHPGTRAELYGGSFGRKAFEFEYGGSYGQFDWFLTGNIFRDDGWRPVSQSDVHQIFGKIGWETETTDIDLSYTFADNRLNGVGPTPESFLNADRHAIYTTPDVTKNLLNFVNLKVSHQMTLDWVLVGNAYYRGNTVDTFNSNIGEGCAAFFDLSQCLDGEGNLIPAASNAKTQSAQDGTGATLQLSYLGKLFQWENQFTLGGSYDFGHTHFTQSEQDAVFTPARATAGTGDFAPVTDVISENEYIGAFATDTFSVSPWLHLNAAARWNRAEIRLSDRLGTALTGDHAFDRINPSAGFTLQPLDVLALKAPIQDMTFYFNYNEGFRAPSPVELTCADPTAPCSLPNSFIADPPLKPVVARTWEMGLRGKWGEALRWAIAGHRTDLSNDILFVNTPGGLINGFFQNVGDTRRQGVELNLRGQWQRLFWYANYGLVDATYQSNAILQSALGPVPVQPGDRIPGIPEHTVKLGVEYELLPGWFLGSDLLYASSQFVRGDDNNRLPQVPEYVVVNLNTRYRVTKYLEVFAMANNVLDQDYETFGGINTNFFTGQAERFLGPGAPIAGWAGLRMRLD